MKLCDLTQFYSPLSGGVKRYVHEKIAFIRETLPDDEHLLIIPGDKTEMIEEERSRIYSIHSPLLSRTSRYRALLNLRAIDEILERERPDLIECGDPYQVAWKAIAAGRAFRMPVVGFYHSHFPEAYLRSASKYLGQSATRIVMAGARNYVRKLYSQFDATLVPSERLARTLEEWGVSNVRAVSLGVNARVFQPQPPDRNATRNALGIPVNRKLLLYIGRLAAEKNTSALFASFRLLSQRRPGVFHLLVVGDGSQRSQVQELQDGNESVSWLQYCTDSHQLARFYRAADLFVHPGIQETFGFVALESQACGTPVVGIRGSYMDRIIFHDQRSWARANTPEALADAIEDLCHEELQTIGRQAAREAEEQHAWPTVFERLFCIYREVCANYKEAAMG